MKYQVTTKTITACTVYYSETTLKRYSDMICGHARECYIDGVWNKLSVEDWLTEIQLPICAKP